jgi:hypothetical protein
MLKNTHSRWSTLELRFSPSIREAKAETWPLVPDWLLNWLILLIWASQFTTNPTPWKQILWSTDSLNGKFLSSFYSLSLRCHHRSTITKFPLLSNNLFCSLSIPPLAAIKYCLLLILFSHLHLILNRYFPLIYISVMFVQIRTFLYITFWFVIENLLHTISFRLKFAKRSWLHTYEYLYTEANWKVFTERLKD